MRNSLPASDKLQQQLEALPLFQACQPWTRQCLLEAASLRRVARREWLYAQGEPQDGIHIVLSGCMEVSAVSPVGKRYVRWYLRTGEIMGLIGVFDGKGAVWDISAHEDSELLHIPRQALLSALRQDATLTLALLSRLCERSRKLYEDAEAEALLPMRARVARMLLMLMDAHGEERGGAINIPIKLSQDDLAAMLAVARQHLNKILREFEQEGYLTLSYSQIAILNPAALRALAADWA